MYTIFGGKGFVGSNIANKLKESNLEIFIPSEMIILYMKEN